MQFIELSRVLDQTGRLAIPAKVRKRYGIITGKEYDFYFHSENGKRFLCIDITDASLEHNIRAAKKFLLDTGEISLDALTNIDDLDLYIDEDSEEEIDE